MQSGCLLFGEAIAPILSSLGVWLFLPGSGVNTHTSQCRQGTATAQKQGGLKGPMCTSLASDLEEVLPMRLSRVLFLTWLPTIGSWEDLPGEEQTRELSHRNTVPITLTVPNGLQVGPLSLH